MKKKMCSIQADSMFERKREIIGKKWTQLPIKGQSDFGQTQLSVSIFELTKHRETKRHRKTVRKRQRERETERDGETNRKTNKET